MAVLSHGINTCLSQRPLRGVTVNIFKLQTTEETTACHDCKYKHQATTLNTQSHCRPCPKAPAQTLIYRVFWQWANPPDNTIHEHQHFFSLVPTYVHSIASSMSLFIRSHQVSRVRIWVLLNSGIETLISWVETRKDALQWQLWTHILKLLPCHTPAQDKQIPT